MKLCLANVTKLKNKSENELFKRACEYVIDEWYDYDDKKNIFTDVLYHGCQSGVVGFLVWYSDTVAFYKEYQEDINELLQEYMDGTGLYAMKDLFGGRWEFEDPLALDCYNQNLLAWFGFEESLRNVGRQFEVLEDYI